MYVCMYVIVSIDTNKDVTRLGKCQRYKGRILQCNLTEEFLIKSKHLLNSFIFIVSNGKHFTIVIDSNIKLSMLFPIRSKRKLIRMPVVLHQFGSLLYSVQHAVVCMSLCTCRLCVFYLCFQLIMITYWS